MPADRLSLSEVLGLSPWRLRLRETVFAVRGDALTPPSRFDHTSLRILQPRLALAVWRGQRPFGRAVPIYNLFNRTPTPIERGWSVRKTQVRDFQGGALTYDSHNGTDFATAPGTVIVAPAAGRAILVVSEFHRGGLKLLLDHGDGLATSYAHLARVLIAPGDVVARGQPIALSGASGLNFVAALGADPPHLHFNVWLDGEPVDPFAVAGEASLWRRANDPTPGATDRDLPPTTIDDARLAAQLDACRDPDLAARLRAIPDRVERALATIFARNYQPMRFTDHVSPYVSRAARVPALDLPFAATDYERVHLPSP
ncbi:MAG: M23 family metallopeptidase [Myxococcales bacterium]|nr:M23 family metallopeptidase [Myxococcales bacterium]